MPEVLGEAGVYFDPENPDDIAAAIRALIESPALRGRHARLAFERAQQFSWCRCADETFSFLRGRADKTISVDQPRSAASADISLP